MRWLASEFDYRFSRKEERFGQNTVCDLIDEVQQAVGIGQPHTVPGTWPNLVRQLYQEQDFHIVGNRVFKKRDPIEAAENGNWGTDIRDADELAQQEYISNLLETSAEAREFLSKNGNLLIDKANEEDALNYAINGLDADKISSIFELLDSQAGDLNSPFSALGYQKPRDQYEMRAVERHVLIADKAAERRAHFADLKAEAEDLDNEEAINLFTWRIRDDYYRDKELRQLWNEEARKQARLEFSQGLRDNGADEETIRRALWAKYDMRRHNAPPRYILVEGKRLYMDKNEWERRARRAKASRDAQWYRERSYALAELTLTSSQWNEIYTILRRKREECRNRDKQNSRYSKHYLKQLEAFIQKATSRLQLDKIRYTLPSYEGRLTSWDRRQLWEKFRERERIITKNI
ncbi:MAG: hypothetical protein DRN26_02030 [Thermoplasmata archaeon]|nr:MAG: hypothetical protein DRN26_02030 [Thermoplasmata archaeon]